jgi:3'-phosphoadenosine 5'-phosphosulfate sulfotransferase (PAPS reductase)/FAD synthetase
MNIISISTGLSSALTGERVLKRFGKDETEFVFMDTLIEDEDNYRFMRECRERWGIPITILTEGRTPYQVAKDKNIIPNQKIAPCTFRLKINLFRNYLQEHHSGEDITIHIGYDYQEMNRIESTEKNYRSYGWNVDFPLLWKPYEFRPYPVVVKEDWGIEPPRMYALGYTHANCGGTCVKQGMGDWLRTLKNWPDRYMAAEEWEEAMRDHPKRKDYAILRDQTQGKVCPLTLRELRERHEKNISKDVLFDMDYHSACVVCGVGDLVSNEENYVTDNSK